MPAFKPPGQCPACGEWVPRHAVACDSCGACSRSGWTAHADVYDGLDLPDDSGFDYEAFIAEEFGHKRPKTGMNPLWWWAAVALLAAFALSYLLPMWR